MIAWTIVTVIFARRNTEALKDVISAKQQSHKREVELLKSAQALERKFDEQNKQLSEKQAEDVKEIVIKSKGNPEEIKRKIENEFGITFVN